MPDVGAVVHTHSRYAAAFSVARLDLPFICNESIATRAERVLVTEYAPPGSVDLGEQALATFRVQPGSRAVLLANHGVVAIGPTVGDAYVVAQSVEWTAEICHLARTLRRRRRRRARPRPAGARGDRPQLRRDDHRRLMDADEVIARFGLAPLPVEGGFFRQLLAVPPSRAPDGTAILVLLTDAPDGFSQFHRLDVDEIWHYYLGDPLELVLLEPGGHEPPPAARPRRARRRHEVVAVVPAGRGWRPGRRGAGACSARRWRPASPTSATRTATGSPAGRLAGRARGHRGADQAPARPGTDAQLDHEFRNRRSRAPMFRSRTGGVVSPHPTHTNEGEHESDQDRRSPRRGRTRSCSVWRR